MWYTGSCLGQLDERAFLFATGNNRIPLLARAPAISTGESSFTICPRQAAMVLIAGVLSFHQGGMR